MKLSKTFVKTAKNISAEEKSINAQLLQRGGFVVPLMAGIYSYLPMWLRVLKKIEQIVREEMNAIDGEEMIMPALQPKSNWEKTWRWEHLDVLFKFTSFYTKTEYALWATHEEIISPLMKNFILSYKDLPRYAYQFQNKFRDEKRAKSWILRWREFVMKDLYSFHANQEDLDEYYAKAQQAYKNVYERVWIGNETYMTFASWGTFSKYSHEFQTVTDAGEDIIYACEGCKVAVNKEIYDEQNVCPECGNAKLVEKKAAEVGNIFKLSTKYSDPFELKYVDKNWEQNTVIMWCYGIGITRLMWVAVEVCHDDKWIVWPESIAPYKYIIIPIWDKGIQMWEQIYQSFLKQWIEVVMDDRDESAGFKFKDADLIGYPYQIVVSEKTLANGENMVEVTNRKTGEKTLKNWTELK